MTDPSTTIKVERTIYELSSPAVRVSLSDPDIPMSAFPKTCSARNYHCPNSPKRM